MAALMVVVHHASLFAARINSGSNDLLDPHFWPNGAAGVDIFFVISGFVMTLATSNGKGESHSARHFLGNRAVRIYPIYWFVMGIFLLQYMLLLQFPSLATRGEIYFPLTWPRVLASLFLIPAQSPPIIGVAWTLSYECLFYLWFSLALALRAEPIKIVAPLAILFAVIGHFSRPGWPAITGLFTALPFEFVAGICVGHLAIKGMQIPFAVAASILLVGTALLFNLDHGSPNHRIVAWGIPATMIVLGIAGLEGRFGHRWSRFVLLVGNASYSLYLVHVLVVQNIAKCFEASGMLSLGAVDIRTEIVFILICVGLSLLVSILLYLRIEKPMTNWLRSTLLGEGKPREQLT